MASRRPARSCLIAIAPIPFRVMIGLCCGGIVAIAAATFGVFSASADPVVSENVPLPVPAPLPKTGTTPAPAAAAAKPATDKAATDKAATDKAANDKAANDKAANDKAATERPSLFPF